MPKKLKVSPNQRVDIPDFERSASGFSHESDSLLRSQILQARKALVLDGFRVEVADQSANPGQLTVFNGVAIDRSGKQITNEDQENDSRTITLPGSNTTFYVEIEYTESESDVDARAFWDPSYDNIPPLPPGREFIVNVATRLSQDWRIVTPVSTSGFAVDTDPNSNKIPIAELSTNGVNEITASGLVTPSSNLAQDATASSTDIHLIDTRIFPDTGTLTVGFGSSLVESTGLVSNDRANNILTVSPALSNAHRAGDVVKIAGVPSRFVAQNAASDKRIRMFGGDETRGTALLASTTNHDQRDDVNIRSLKDQVDAMAASIREIKYGTPRVGDIPNRLPPVTGINDRWYEHAANLQSVRGFDVTIGDGVESIGDLNVPSGGDLGSVINTAVQSFNGASGSGSIYVKKGVYTFSSSVLVNKDVVVVFQEGATLSGMVDSLFNVDDARLEIRNMHVTHVASSDLVSVSASGGEVVAYDSSFGGIDADTVTTPASLLIQLDRCYISQAHNNVACVTIPQVASVMKAQCFISKCEFIASGSPSAHVSGNWSSWVIEDTSFTLPNGGTVSLYSRTGLSNARVKHCSFYGTNLGSVVGIYGELNDVVFSDCDFSGVTIDCSLTPGFFPARNMVYVTQTVGVWGGTGIQFSHCRFTDTVDSFTNSDLATGNFISIDSDLDSVVVEGCQFGSIKETSDTQIFQRPIRITESSSSLGNVIVRDCDFRHFYVGVWVQARDLVIDSNRFVVSLASSTPRGGDKGIWATTYNSTCITNNYFNMKYDNSTMGGDAYSRYAIYNNLATLASTIIDNNNIDEMSTTVSSTSSHIGIWVGMNDECVVRITNNTINDIFKTGSTASNPVHAIRVRDFSSLTKGNLIVSSNTIRSTVYSAHAGTWVMIDNQVEGAVVSGNKIECRIMSAINIGGGSLLCNNFLRAGQRVVRLLGNATVENNVINCYGDGGPYIPTIGVDCSSAEGLTAKISGNSMNCGIRLGDVANPVNPLNVSINSNDIAVDTVAPGSIIDVYKGSGPWQGMQLSIQNNHIRQGTEVPKASAIRLGGGTSAQVCITGNHYLGTSLGTSSTSPPVIDVSNVNQLDVSGNFVQNTSAGTHVRVDDCTLVSVNNNNLVGGGSYSGYELIQITDCDMVLWGGNFARCFLNAAGTYSTAGSTNVTTGVNSFS